MCCNGSPAPVAFFFGDQVLHKRVVKLNSLFWGTSLRCDSKQRLGVTKVLQGCGVWQSAADMRSREDHGTVTD